jgi:hypothetical protein
MKKKCTLLLVSIGLWYFSFAQLNYGFKIGVTQSKTKESFTSMYQDMNFKSGFQLGIFFENKLFKNISVRPALQLTQKGYEAVEGNENDSFFWYRKWSFTYLEIPIDFIYNLPLSKKTSIYIGTGPVIGVGLFGHGKGTIKGTDGAGQSFTQEGTGNKPFSRPGFKDIDLGADFVAGLQFRRVAFAASYNHGLLNALNFDHGIQSTKNRSFAISLSYILSRN